jgi:hypothetical protein
MNIQLHRADRSTYYFPVVRWEEAAPDPIQLPAETMAAETLAVLGEPPGWVAVPW